MERAAASVALGSTPNPSVLGVPVTFTATVGAVAPGAGSPGGTVSFDDGGSNLGALKTKADPVTDENGIRWDSGADTGTAPPDGGFYLAKGGPNAMFGMLVEYMLDKGEVNLLPTGTARLRDGGTLAIEECKRLASTAIDGSDAQQAVDLVG